MADIVFACAVIVFAHFCVNLPHTLVSNKITSCVFLLLRISERKCQLSLEPSEILVNRLHLGRPASWYQLSWREVSFSCQWIFVLFWYSQTHTNQKLLAAVHARVIVKTRNPIFSIFFGFLSSYSVGQHIHRWYTHGQHLIARSQKIRDIDMYTSPPTQICVWRK